MDIAPSAAGQLQPSKQMPRNPVHGAVQVDHRPEAHNQLRVDQGPVERHPQEFLAQPIFTELLNAIINRPNNGAFSSSWASANGEFNFYWEWHLLFEE